MKKIILTIFLLAVPLVCFAQDAVTQATPKYQKEISITTDKKEYAVGDIVKIVVRNGLDEPVWGEFNSDCGGMPFWGLQKLTDGDWVNLTVDMPFLDGKDFGCHLIFCERTYPVALKPNSEIKDEWNITYFCNYVDEYGHLLDKPKVIKIEEGTYRLVLTYGLKVSNEDRFIIENINTVYSNKFIVK